MSSLLNDKNVSGEAKAIARWAKKLGADRDTQEYVCFLANFRNGLGGKAPAKPHEDYAYAREQRLIELGMIEVRDDREGPLGKKELLIWPGPEWLKASEAFKESLAPR